MNYSPIYLIYSLLAACYLIWIIIRSEKRLSSGLISFWVLFFPILNREEYLISLPWGFDLQPTRIFLIGGLLILSGNILQMIVMKGKLVRRQKIASFEILMLVYIIISSAVIMITTPGFRAMVPLVSGQLVFAVMYYIARDHLNKGDTRMLENMIIIFGVLSALVAIVQFYFDPQFFRISSVRSAFGDYIRSNGFMTNEYDNGLLLTMLLPIALIRFKSNKLKLLTALLFGIGVYFTMHRMSWIIFLTTILIYVMFKIRLHEKTSMRRLTIFIYLAILSGLVALLIFFNWPHLAEISQAFLTEQLFRETLNIRQELNFFGLDLIGQQPFGIGDFNSTHYWQAYVKAGLPFAFTGPLIIHNGFIATGVKYGIFGGLAFLTFMMSVFGDGIKKALAFNQNGLVILMISTSMILINLTNEMSPLGSFSHMYFAFCLGAMKRMVDNQ